MITLLPVNLSQDVWTLLILARLLPAKILWLFAEA